MAIYRGTGGSGDSTQDTTLNEVTLQATNAASSASAAATSATSASTSATTATTQATAASTSATNAATSATQAATSATNAATSETNAGTSETNAATSETNAATSATNAATSATSAATSETNASASATSASTSATTATTQAATATTQASTATTKAAEALASQTAAAASETSAATSAATATTQASTATTKASEASTSATAAAASETAAATSATNAAASESSVATNATNAATSETNAATSETNAATSATTATTKATEAATSETNAATSATTATTKASEASTSATNAATSATSAAASLASFTGQYVSQTTAPSSPDTGDLWFDETSAIMKVYNGTSWANAGSSVNGTENSVQYTATAGQTTFAATYDVGFVQVYLNGIRLDTSDYTATNGTSVVLDVGAAVDDSVFIQAFGTFVLADHYTKVASDARYAQESYVDAEIAALVDSSPAALDTLNELAAALGDDPNFATTVNNNIATKLPLAGGTLTGDVAHGDNVKAKFGNADDLQIYHDGTDTWIDESGAGSLKIKGNYLQLLSPQDELYFQGQANGSSYIYQNGSEKLATTSTGVDVTGTVTADGLTVTGTLGNFAVDAQGAIATFSRPSTSYIRASDVSGALRFDSGGSLARLNIASNGDISFYEDTGTTAKFYWDASAERLGIGTSSPARPLHVKHSTSGALKLETTSDNFDAYVEFETVDNAAFIGIDDSQNVLKINNTSTLGGANHLAIDSSGNVGIGTSSPSSALDVIGEATIGNGTDGIKLSYSASSNAGVIDTADTSDTLSVRTSGSERMRIDSSGNVGIGTSSPTQKLDVTGTVKATSFAGDGSQLTGISSGATGQKAHAWAKISCGSTTNYASYNVSSITDRGSYSRINFASSAGSSHYGYSTMGSEGAVITNAIASTYIETISLNSSGSITGGTVSCVVFRN